MTYNVFSGTLNLYYYQYATVLPFNNCVYILIQIHKH